MPWALSVVNLGANFREENNGKAKAAPEDGGAGAQGAARNVSKDKY
jgi:hypothetical protein